MVFLKEKETKKNSLKGKYTLEILSIKKNSLTFFWTSSSCQLLMSLLEQATFNILKRLLITDTFYICLAPPF